MEETKIYYYTPLEMCNENSYIYTIDDMIDYMCGNSHDFKSENYDRLLARSGDEGLTYVGNALVNRWMQNHIYIVATTYTPEEVKKGDYSQIETILQNLNRPHLNKMNRIIDKYVEEYERLKKVLDKDSFKTSSKSSNKATVKQNDTPTSYGDYRADNYMSNYSETSNENENSVETNELETYDAVVNRLRNLQQEFVDEFKEFEIWI